MMYTGEFILFSLFNYLDEQTMSNEEIRRDLDYILYALGETLCYAEADLDCEQDEIPELVSQAKKRLLNLRSLYDNN